MEHIGIDVHKSQSQIAILTEDGELVEKRIRTDRGRFEAVLGHRPRTRILLEASTESEWVARCLEGLGHEVIVADPNYAPMYGHRNRRVKTDRRDARALVEACRNGTYRPAHRTSDEQRHVRARLAVREALVRTRSRYISLLRAVLRREGLRLRSGSTACILERVAELELPAALQREIQPLLRLFGPLNREIRRADKDLDSLARKNNQVRRLCTVPGVGPVTAASFVATLDTATRFGGAHQVQAYLGLVPRERSSGKVQHKGRITKAGNRRTRSLLVEAAWAVWHRAKRTEAMPLRIWANRIARRRGRRIAMVALARKLAGILFAMMRDKTVYEHERLIAPHPVVA